MRLIFKKTYKSIRTLNPIEMPNFVVLTGVNGAGKSQLLEAIEIGAIDIEGIPPNPMNGHGPRLIRRYDANSLVAQDTGPFSSSLMAQEVSSHWDQVKAYSQQNSTHLYNQLSQLLARDVDGIPLRELWKLDASKLLEWGLDPTQAQTTLQQIRQIIESYENNVSNQFISNDPTNRPRMLEKIKSAAGLPLIAMSQDEFHDSFPRQWQQVDIFQQSFARLFSNYQTAWRENELRILGRNSGRNYLTLSPEEFLEKHGPAPWDFLNRILEIANLDFRINFPEPYEDRPYEPILQDEKRGINVRFADLSSGERILMSFALSLYHIRDPRGTFDYPRVLLFDEIDAPLHPSMTSSLLNTIQKALVEEKAIKVILTTHSPSTVALSPEGSIYAMHKEGRDRVVQVSRDAALGILTAGVPTLSVNYENRRQVFVESTYDVEFYSALYQLVKPKLAPEISISFIASGGGGGDGNCDQVISIAAKLREAGNRTVVGLIDWDLENETSENVQVLGLGDRYAIDNYILDPIAIGLLLLRENILTPEAFGIAGGSYLSIAQAEPNTLQIIGSKVVADLAKNLKDQEKSDANTRAFSYTDGFSANFPKWLAILQGHRLESALKDAYPQLHRFQGEKTLKNQIIKTVFADRWGLIPAAVVEALKELQADRWRTATHH